MSLLQPGVPQSNGPVTEIVTHPTFAAQIPVLYRIPFVGALTALTSYIFPDINPTLSYTRWVGIALVLRLIAIDTHLRRGDLNT